MPELSFPDLWSKYDKNFLLLRFLEMQEVLVGADFLAMFLPVLPLAWLLSVTHSRIAIPLPRSKLMMFKMISIGRAAMVQVPPWKEKVELKTARNCVLLAVHNKVLYDRDA